MTVRATSFGCAVLITMLAAAGDARARRAAGPLRVLETNPRYFTDGTGRAVYLVGSHTWVAQQDLGETDPPPSFDYEGFVDMMQSHGHNFMRYWMYETARYAPWAKGDYYYHPLPWARTGPGEALDGKPKFDLTKFDQEYFDRMRRRVEAAGERGIYCAVMLFQGWSIERKGRNSGNPWPGHPFNKDNNVNGIDGDLDGDGEGEEMHTLADPAVTRLQELYIRKVVDSVNDLDNVLYEIANETHGNAVKWHYHIIDYIHAYEAEKPEQHPVGMTACGRNSDLFASPAEWVSPWGGGGYKDDPPASDGSKVVVSDTDHISWSHPRPQWIWKSFCRGIHYIFMDWDDGRVLRGNESIKEPMRTGLGHVRMYADMMNLAAMTPRSPLSSTRYCLANAAAEGAEYLVYLPSGGECAVNLSASPTALHVEWYNPRTTEIVDGGACEGGTARTFEPPWKGEAVLYLSGTVDFFAAEPEAVGWGNSSVLRWRVSGATGVTLDGEAVPASGSTKVSPDRTTTYVLSADGPGGAVVDRVSVGVGEPAALAEILVAPASASIQPGGAREFVARPLDQYRTPMSAAVTWHVSGGGTIAPGAGGTAVFTSDGIQGRFRVTASSGKVVGTAALTVAKVLIRVNCGPNEPEVEGWQRDDKFVRGGNDYTFPVGADTAGVPNAAPAGVYRTCRHMDHSYSFGDVPDGTYTVRIHFFDAYSGSGRAMDYTIEGVKVLDDFTVAKAAGSGKALVKEFSVTVADGDGLQIVARTDKGNDVFDSGIEILGRTSD